MVTVQALSEEQLAAELTLGPFRDLDLIALIPDPGARAYSIVTDLTEGGYVVKDKDGRRNRYQIQSHLPLREAITQERTIGEVLDVLVKSKIRRRGRRAPG